MLAKANRLAKDSDFKKLARAGKAYYGRFLTLRILPAVASDCRIGMVISAKVSKKAVIRNKLKRQLSEIFRLALPRFTKKVDLMVIVRPAMTQATFSIIKQDLLDLLAKIKLI